MKIYDEVLVVRMDTGEKICVCAPYGKTEIGDFVRTKNGLSGVVIKKERDLTGSVMAIAAELTTVYEVSEIWGCYWKAEVTADA